MFSSSNNLASQTNRLPLQKKDLLTSPARDSIIKCCFILKNKLTQICNMGTRIPIGGVWFHQRSHQYKCQRLSSGQQSYVRGNIWTHSNWHYRLLKILVLIDPKAQVQSMESTSTKNQVLSFEKVQNAAIERHFMGFISSRKTLLINYLARSLIRLITII